MMKPESSVWKYSPKTSDNDNNLLSPRQHKSARKLTPREKESRKPGPVKCVDPKRMGI